MAEQTGPTLSDSELARFVRRGHFVYESGDHGDLWLELGLLLEEPRLVRAGVARLAGLCRGMGAGVVCGVSGGGALVARLLAQELGLDCVCAERVEGAVGAQRLPEAARARAAGARVLVVDDAVNAGTAVLGCVRELGGLGANVVGVGCLIVRAGAEREIAEHAGAPVVAVATLPWHTWPAAKCPMCAAGVGIGAGAG